MIRIDELLEVPFAYAKTLLTTDYHMYRKLFWLAPLLLTLNACTPHPSSGGWRATSADPLFERLEVRFNGNADFILKQMMKLPPGVASGELLINRLPS